LKYKKILNAIGLLFGLSGVVFVTFKLSAYTDNIDHWILGTGDWVLLIILAICYGFAGLFLASGWRFILIYLGPNVRFGWSVWAYGVSQLAKYVPGNIFHLAGRQAIGAGAGISHGVLAKSTIGELLIIALAACFFIILPLPYFVPAVSEFESCVLFLSLLALALYVMFVWLGASLTKAFVHYICFLALSGLIFVGIAFLILPDEMISFNNILPLLGAYVVAWLVGLVTPGAPAGVGVREVVLLFLLNGLIPESKLLLLVLLGRVVTVIGDLFFYIYAVSFARTWRVLKKL